MRNVALPAGWGEAALFDAGEAPWTGDGITRSYDHGGACLAWRPPAGRRGACDMERADVDVAAWSRRLGLPPGEFLLQWVAAEVAAKLEDVPMVLRVRAAGLRPPAGPFVLLQDPARLLAFGLDG